jgi:diguanylate cyclase (GGDEF)-like protein
MLALCAILSIGFITTSTVSYFVARDSLTHQISTDTLPLIGDNIYSEIQQDLLKPILISSLMANDSFLQDWVIRGEYDESKITNYLRNIQTKYDTVTSFFISDKSYKYYHTSGIFKKVSPNSKIDQWYFSAKKAESTHQVNIDYDQHANNTLTVFINYKVFDEQNNFLGITGVGLALDKVLNLIESYQNRYQRDVFFINQKGKATLHSSSYGGPIDYDYPLPDGTIKEKLLTQKNAKIEYWVDNQKVLINSRYIEEFDWYLVIRQNGQSSDNQLFESLMLNLLISLIVTVVVLGLAWLTLSNYQNKLEEMATTDKLTGLNNRQMFDPILEQKFHSAIRQNSPLSLAILDIDKFKSINDLYGHPFGDKVLQEAALLLKNTVRKSDVLCRWGGEEFVILFPDTDAQQAQEIVLKIQQLFSQHQFSYQQQDFNIYWSVGVADKGQNDQPADLVLRADQALLKAKNNGRNQVIVS